MGAAGGDRGDAARCASVEQLGAGIGERVQAGPVEDRLELGELAQLTGACDGGRVRGVDGERAACRRRGQGWTRGGTWDADSWSSGAPRRDRRDTTDRSAPRASHAIAAQEEKAGQDPSASRTPCGGPLRDPRKPIPPSIGR